MFTLSKTHNINYVAKVVKINNLRKHGNADRLRCTSIDGCNVIIGANQNEGDVGIFFPPECQINESFLCANNLYKDKDLNQDPTKTGFFDKNGRVKVLKLRGEKSEGFFIPVEALNHKPFNADYESVVAHEGKEFDSVNGLLLVKKYRIIYQHARNPGEQNKTKKAAKSQSILVENQFHFHIDTPPLGKNAWRFSPSTFISITQKLHGTSFISAKVLTKRLLRWTEKVARFFGVSVVETEFKNLYSSRKVIKNITGMNKGSYYNEDIWGMANTVVEPHLKNGMTVYGEIVGYLPSGQGIQKRYDYSCPEGKHQVYVYRITWTLPDGHVVDWSWGQIKEWCRFHGLLHVPELYRGPSKYFMSAGAEGRNDQTFLDKLKDLYLEKKAKDLDLVCVPCKNDVWDEGIVVRIEDSSDFDVFKLKSFNFFAYESKELDSGEADIESLQDQDVVDDTIEKEQLVA